MEDILPLMRMIIGIVMMYFLFTPKCISQFDINNYETASSVQGNRVIANLSYGINLFSYNDNTDIIFNQLKLSFGFGIHEQVELKLSYSNLHDDQMNSLHLIQLSPKFRGNKDYIAFKMNFGIFIQDHYMHYSDHKFETFYRFSPRCLITYVSTRHFNLTFIPAFDFIFGNNFNGGVAATTIGCSLGFGFSSNMEVWSIRPEFGLAKGLSESNNWGFVWTPGLGLTINF